MSPRGSWRDHLRDATVDSPPAAASEVLYHTACFTDRTEIGGQIADKYRFALLANRKNLDLRVYVLSPSSRTDGAAASAHCRMWNESMGSFRELESRPRESSMAVVGSYIAGGIADLVLRKHDGGTSEAKECV